MSFEVNWIFSRFQKSSKVRVFGKRSSAARLVFDRCKSDSWFRSSGCKDNTRELSGGADGIRTHDLLDAIEARSQLRHGPTGWEIAEKTLTPQ
jgi:hypothetical protein